MAADHTSLIDIVIVIGFYTKHNEESLVPLQQTLKHKENIADAMEYPSEF